MSKSSIEWTTETWNPIVGCSILTPGCIHCYAMGMAARIEAINQALVADGKPMASPQYAGTTKKVNGHAVWTGKLAMAGDNILLAPLKRKKPTTYFVNSMGDLFHEDCPDEWIDKVFAVMALSPQHTFQVLTKRAARMRDYLSDDDGSGRIAEIADSLWARHLAPGNLGYLCRDVRTDELGFKDVDFELGQWPLPNVWLGVSTERQQEADERIPLLLQTPAAIRFISAEPLLGPIDLTNHCNGHYFFNSLTGTRWHDDPDHSNPEQKFAPGLDWVIVGGESGPDARPMHPGWARRLRDQCKAAGVPFFFKQWGAHAPSFSARPAESVFFDSSKMVACSKKSAGRSLDGIEYNEMPGVR